MQKARKAVLPAVLVLIALTVLLLVQPVAADNGGSTFHVAKETDPPGLDREFEFTATQLSVPAGDLPEFIFTLAHGQEVTIDNPFGTEFRVAETVPDGWTVRIDCSIEPGDEDRTDFDWIKSTGKGWVVIAVPRAQLPDPDPWNAGCIWTNTPPEEPPPPPPFVPEASTFILLGSAATTMAGYVGLQIRARRRK